MRGCDRLVRYTTFAALLCTLPAGCRRADKNLPAAEPDQPGVEAELIAFPPELHAADEAVNDLVLRALHICLEGDYEAFHLLWTATEEPVARAQFDFGAYAVKQIRVLALERLRDQADDSEIYLFCVRIEFDTERLPAEVEPARTVVLLARWEADAWRLARAPKELRRWILTRAGGEEEETPEPTEPPAEAQPTVRVPHEG